MLTSGETALASTSDIVVPTIDLRPTGAICSHVRIVNEGSAPGFYRYDKGPWCRLPESSILSDDNVDVKQTIEVKRVAGGANLTGVFVQAW